MLNVNKETYRSISRDIRRGGNIYHLYNTYGYFWIEKLKELRTKDMSKIGIRVAFRGGEYSLRKLKAQYRTGARVAARCTTRTGMKLGPAPNPHVSPYGLD